MCYKIIQNSLIFQRKMAAFHDLTEPMMPYGLFRTAYFHNPTQHSHIVKLTLHFYVYAPLRSEQNEHPLDVLLHIGAGH